MSVIDIAGVSKTYKQHRAVKDLSLTVPAGALYGFIGPNGSGKTTTIRMILRIIMPDQGTINVLGESDSAVANNQIGYLPEERGLYKKLTVRRMLTYYGRLKGMSGPAVAKAIDHWLARFELTAWGNKKIETLSKGMSQKVQFIASIIANPKLLILDEPFSGLDPVNAEAIRSSILELQKSGTTIIFSTHDMGVAEKMCDYVFMIYQGDKVLDGTLASIKAEYGADSVHLRWDGSSEQLNSMRQVRRVNDMGGYQELQLDGDPQDLLKQLVQIAPVHLFEVTAPSLHDIFIRIAGPQASVAAHAQEVPA